MTAIYPDLEGKVVLATGGGSGIGAAIVRAFAHQKAKVAFIDIALEPSRALTHELERAGTPVHFERCDLTDIPAVKRSIAAIKARFGPIQVLINNAASDERHDTESLTEAQWDERIAVNLKHQFFCTQAVLPDMKAAGAGSITLLGSIAWLMGYGGMPAYCASKAAVWGLTRSLARDYGAYGIRVNTVVPGWIMTQRQLERWITPELEAQIRARQCLKRTLQPHEVAKFIVFLSSDEASACTQQHYLVDGGWV